MAHPRRKIKSRPINEKWEIAGRPRNRMFQWLTPPRLLGGSFAFLIAIGTLGFMYLPGLYVGEPLGWIDALFTSTSAVCVTGLIVVDTATYFTFWGQAWILLLIQLGGLGMISFSSVIIVALGRRLSLRHQALSSDLQDAAPHLDMRQLALDIVRFTLTLELAGAILLYLLWIPRFGWTGAAWPALFHSVSAFCNAGFSTFTDSLTTFQQSPFSLTLIMVLITAGGLGFLTLEEIYLRYQAGRRKQIFRISLHSRIVLGTSAFLLLGGWVMFAVFEGDHTLGHLPVWHQATNSLFMSVTPRTAGFNTIDYAQVTDSSSFLTIILMMIGGSPGSMAGGMKTTTFALIGLLAWSRLRGFGTTNLSSRSIRHETTERAVGLFVITFGLVTAGIFVLIVIESQQGHFLNHVFEVVSAFNTVGLSMGETPELSPAGRSLIIPLMFFGRIGPLTVAASLAIRQIRQSSFRYAFVDVVVG